MAKKTSAIDLATYPARLFPGLVFLNSGLGKRGLDEEGAKGLQDFAGVALPFVKKLEPTTFGKLLSTAEIVTGAALLTPFVPNVVAGTALAGFGAGFTAMYLRTPGLTEEGSVKPTQDGLPMAKDTWLLGTGLALMLSGAKAFAAKK
ncbi:hypothetical protein [Corynebacterium sp. H113]|uniref:hypothetical protein n=1 Tax=Corynebacterium sp. H113 TaxID=3133419 RepID=UPI0030B1FBB3